MKMKIEEATFVYTRGHLDDTNYTFESHVITLQVIISKLQFVELGICMQCGYRCGSLVESMSSMLLLIGHLRKVIIVG